MDFDALWKAIVAAMKGPLTSGWTEIRTFAETESKKIAHSILTIVVNSKLPSDNEEYITPEQAKLLLDIQEHATRSVLLTSEAIGLIAAQQAIDAGLGAVKDVVNKAIGFALI